MTENLQTDQSRLIEFMDQVGIPNGMLEVFSKVFSFEKGRKKMAQYATLFDFSDPDYRDAVIAQNNRIKQIREAMMTTEIGKLKLESMSKAGIGDDTTIPIPSTTS